MNKAELARQSLKHNGRVIFAEENNIAGMSVEFNRCVDFCIRLKTRYGGSLSDVMYRKKNGNYVFKIIYSPSN